MNSAKPEAVTQVERTRWALARVGDAVKQLRQAPGDRVLALALVARWDEYDAARTAGRQGRHA